VAESLPRWDWRTPVRLAECHPSGVSCSPMPAKVALQRRALSFPWLKSAGPLAGHGGLRERATGGIALSSPSVQEALVASSRVGRDVLPACQERMEERVTATAAPFNARHVAAWNVSSASAGRLVSLEARRRIQDATTTGWSAPRICAGRRCGPDRALDTVDVGACIGPRRADAPVTQSGFGVGWLRPASGAPVSRDPLSRRTLRV
jgi:hypothetical protein